MRNQLSNCEGKHTPERQTPTNNTTTTTDKLSVESCTDTVEIINSEQGEHNVSTDPVDQDDVETGTDGPLHGDQGSNVSLQNKGRTGKSGKLGKTMPPKLLPNFGDDPSRRVRRWNKAAERKFELNMVAMSQQLKSKTTKIDRGIRNMEDQLKDLDLERSYNANSSLESLYDEDSDSRSSYLRFPAIPSSRPHPVTRQVSEHKCSYSSSRKKHNCQHFPCVRPHTYHTIGYRGNPEFTPWMSWEDIKDSWSAPELVDNVSTSAHDVKVTPRLLTLRREEKLRKEIERRKLQNDMRRPPSWVTNYGQPMSYKQLKYPVRLNPITN